MLLRFLSTLSLIVGFSPFVHAQPEPSPTPAPEVIAPVQTSQSIPFSEVSGYPSAKRNADLQEQISGDRDRLAPKFEKFAVAGDGEAFYRLLGQEDYYHGIGYWLQLRSELRPNPKLRLNMRTIFFSGSVSEGYAKPTGFYNLFSITTFWPDIFWGLDFKARGLDLDRQTIGAGLLIQNKEFNGALFSLSRNGHSLTLRAEGTGVFLLNDDTYNAELNFGDGWFGGGVVFWPAGQEQQFLEEDRDSYGYLFSAKRFDWFSYAAEAGTRAGGWGALFALGADVRTGSFIAHTKLEGRKYEDGIGDDFAGEIEHQYVSYDQYDKAFTDAINVFAFDDDAWVTAAHVDLFYRLSHTWRLFSLNEIGKFDFEQFTDEPYYFYRAGASFCPIPDRDDRVNAFVSNKVLQDSFQVPPEKTVRNRNEALFKRVAFAGFEARFRF